MMLIGRSHTVYIDNKSLEYNVNLYHHSYKVVIFVDDEQVTKSSATRKRGIATCIGQEV